MDTCTIKLTSYLLENFIVCKNKFVNDQGLNTLDEH